MRSARGQNPGSPMADPTLRPSPAAPAHPSRPRPRRRMRPHERAVAQTLGHNSFPCSRRRFAEEAGANGASSSPGTATTAARTAGRQGECLGGRLRQPTVPMHGTDRRIYWGYARRHRTCARQRTPRSADAGTNTRNAHKSRKRCAQRVPEWSVASPPGPHGPTLE